MGNTRSCKPEGDQVTHPFCPAESPGCLGLHDRADPNARACYGDSPGSVGFNDLAAAQAGVYYDEEEQVCRPYYFQEFASSAIRDARIPSEKAESNADADVVVISSRIKEGWEAGVNVSTDDKWFRIGTPEDRKFEEGLRRLYPLIEDDLSGVAVHRFVRYTLPPLAAGMEPAADDMAGQTDTWPDAD